MVTKHKCLELYPSKFIQSRSNPLAVKMASPVVAGGYEVSLSPVSPDHRAQA